MTEIKPTKHTENKTDALIKREYRRMAVGLDRMCDWDFAHDSGENPAITEIGQNYVASFDELKKDGMGLMYFGGSGAGKSYAAAQIVNALTDAGYNCLFTSFRNILTDLGTLGNEGKRDYLNKLFRKDLLVFDEYGSEGDTCYNSQMVLQIISNCYQRCIPMIVTTPYHRDSLVKSNNPQRLQALSRLWQRCCCIQVNVPRSRRNQSQNQMYQTEALLKGSYCEEAEDYEEPCQKYREEVLRKEEIAKAEAKAKAKEKAKTKKIQPKQPEEGKE